MLTPSAADAVADAFGLRRARPGSPGPVARGQLGQVWRLDTAARRLRGQGVVRDARPRRRLAGRRLRRGGTAPRASSRHGSCARGLGRRSPRSVGRAPPSGSSSGSTCERGPGALDPVAVGRTLAGLHRAGAPTRDGVDNWFATGFGEPSWRDLHRRLVDEDAPFAGELGALVDELVAVESVIEPHESPIVCHRDLWADNVLEATDGRVCVIDFENMGPADPSQELAMVLFEFGDDDPSRARRLHTAYREAGGPGRVTRRGHFTMLVAEQAHIGQLACSRWVGATKEAERDAPGARGSSRSPTTR